MGTAVEYVSWIRSRVETCTAAPLWSLSTILSDVGRAEPPCLLPCTCHSQARKPLGSRLVAAPVPMANPSNTADTSVEQHVIEPWLRQTFWPSLSNTASALSRIA